MRSRVFNPLLVLALTLVISPAAWATPPATWVATYAIHETPSEPNSPITFVAHVTLLRSEFTSTAIGWEITSVRVDQYLPGHPQPTTWTDDSPTTSESAGLWWTQHADPNSPKSADFTVPPHITGTASPDTLGATALQYDIGGGSSGSGSPYNVTAWLDYVFTLAGDPDPMDEGTDVPTNTTSS